MPSELLEEDYLDINLPPKMCGLFEGVFRYRGAKGGRGSGKTRGFAKMAAIQGYIWGSSGISGQILAAREHLNSIEESSLQEIKMAIAEEPILAEYYDVGEKYIRSHDRRIEFVFAGLRRNLNNIKSKARLLLCWVDEAESVTEKSWGILIPTVREEGSEIWVSWNPEVRGNATDKRFVQDPSDDMHIIEMNYLDNPWFPEVLEKERLNDKRLRPDTYEHIWLGEYLEYAEGAYYLNEMKRAKEEGRIGRVPYDPALPVTTSWDLGIGDDMVLWFTQEHGSEVRAIDYYANNGYGLDHYVKHINDKPYVYGQHILPHDVEVRELGTGKSRKEVLMGLGVSPIYVCPAFSVDDGIQASRALINRTYFDEVKCADGINCLRQYRREYNEVNQCWHNRPLHNWASHGADGWRYRAMGHISKAGWGNALKRNVKGIPGQSRR